MLETVKTIRKRGRGWDSLLPGATDFIKREEMWKKIHFRFCFTKICGRTTHFTSGRNSGRTSDIVQLEKVYILRKT